MSLINDALKRASQAQQQSPPTAGGPALKPAGPAETKSATGAKNLLFIMVACVIVGNALLFLAVKDRGARPVAAAPAPSGALQLAAVPAPNPPPAPAIVSVPPAVPAQAVTSVVADTASDSDSATTATNVVASESAVVFENPKPAPLRLQSIIYNPARPSAMIGGKFLFLGDRIQGFRVTAIDQESVTLIGNGQTNVLSLP